MAIEQGVLHEQPFNGYICPLSLDIPQLKSRREIWIREGNTKETLYNASYD
jgi:hypothetical protein